MGLNDAKQTQNLANKQWQRRDNLNRDFAKQSQDNRNAMSASLKDTQATIKDAEERFLKSVEEYRDTTAQDMSAVAAGIRTNARQAMQEAGQYTNPDGTMKTSQEIEQGQRVVRDQIESQVQQAITPIASNYNNAITQMKQNFTGFAVANAQIRAAQQMQAIQYDMQQRGYLSDLIASNPETHVNLLDTLLAIGNVNAARQPVYAGGGSLVDGSPQSQGGQPGAQGGRVPASNGTPNPFDSLGYRNYGKNPPVNRSNLSTGVQSLNKFGNQLSLPRGQAIS